MMMMMLTKMKKKMMVMLNDDVHDDAGIATSIKRLRHYIAAFIILSISMAARPHYNFGKRLWKYGGFRAGSFEE